MSIDLGKSLRKTKPERRTSQLEPRSGQELVEWTSLAQARPAALLLDANVYINRASGLLPQPLREIVDDVLLFHCSVALAELAVGVANADPARAGWSAVCDHYTELFEAVPASRLVTPDAQTWADAGLVAGTLARTQRFQPHQRKDCLNDALIFLTAARVGVPVLTANRDDFDLIQQIAPDGRFVYY